jgi:hypothetical protein
VRENKSRKKFTLDSRGTVASRAQASDGQGRKYARLATLGSNSRDRNHYRRLSENGPESPRMGAYRCDVQPQGNLSGRRTAVGRGYVDEHRNSALRRRHVSG